LPPHRITTRSGVLLTAQARLEATRKNRLLRRSREAVGVWSAPSEDHDAERSTPDGPSSLGSDEQKNRLLRRIREAVGVWSAPSQDHDAERSTPDGPSSLGSDEEKLSLLRRSRQAVGVWLPPQRITTRSGVLLKAQARLEATRKNRLLRRSREAVGVWLPPQRITTLTTHGLPNELNPILPLLYVLYSIE
jgi:hypothetical protein